MQLGPYSFDTPIILAPMAGVSDRVFRGICRARGAHYAPSEMTAANPALRDTVQTRRRRDLDGDASPRIVQIAGADPGEMAAAARAAAAEGAEIIDINMGCPAKRVCHRLAGSALLKDEPLVAAILSAVVNAVPVPVTLKTRTGWDRASRNAVRIARLAESVGIRALTLHGRTRACGYQGDAEHDTLAEVKAAVTIPVIANGDITDVEKARAVLAHTRADGLMIGRAAQGDPWIFARIAAGLAGRELAPPSLAEVRATMHEHVAGLHAWYGESLGVRIARKHAGWYFTRWFARGAILRARFNAISHAEAQLEFIDNPTEIQLGEAA
ncbi:MAG: tRNA dihydrouridine synthase DusB [Gammaproteobacteria bacterium]